MQVLAHIFKILTKSLRKIQFEPRWFRYLNLRKQLLGTNHQSDLIQLRKIIENMIQLHRKCKWRSMKHDCHRFIRGYGSQQSYSQTTNRPANKFSRFLLLYVCVNVFPKHWSIELQKQYLQISLNGSVFFKNM